MQTFANYSDAKAAAERIMRKLSDGSQAAALNVTQSRDAIAAFERLQEFFQASGRRVSLLAAVSEFVEASGKLGGRTMSEAVEGYRPSEYAGIAVLRLPKKTTPEDLLQTIETFAKGLVVHAVNPLK